MVSLATTAKAIEPLGVEILGLRLGMPATETVTRLRAQAAQDMRFVPPDCPGTKDASCPSSVTARTRDGTLELHFGPAGTGVIRIDYTLDGRGPNEQQMIRQAIRDRFGPPSVPAPVRWCSAAAVLRGCPDDSPRLELAEGPGTAMRLVLTAGDLGDYLGGTRPVRSDASPSGQFDAPNDGRQRQ
jgi:hypothetical protein